MYCFIYSYIFLYILYKFIYTYIYQNNIFKKLIYFVELSILENKN